MCLACKPLDNNEKSNCLHFIVVSKFLVSKGHGRVLKLNQEIKCLSKYHKAIVIKIIW